MKTRALIAGIAALFLATGTAYTAHADNNFYQCKIAHISPGYYQVMPLADVVGVETDDQVIKLWFPGQNNPVVLALYSPNGSRSIPNRVFAGGFWNTKTLELAFTSAQGVASYACQLGDPNI